MSSCKRKLAIQSAKKLGVKKHAEKMPIKNSKTVIVKTSEFDGYAGKHIRCVSKNLIPRARDNKRFDGGAHIPTCLYLHIVIQKEQKHTHKHNFGSIEKVVTIITHGHCFSRCDA